MGVTVEIIILATVIFVCLIVSVIARVTHIKRRKGSHQNLIVSNMPSKFKLSWYLL